MSAFWNKKKEQDDQKKEALVSEVKKANSSAQKSEAKKSSKDSKKKAKKVDYVPKDKALFISKVIIKPLVSEDVMVKQEMGKYVFQVSQATNKKEIEKAVKAMYKVDVKSVNIVNYKPRSKSFRGYKGRAAGYKKAIVTVAKGQTIDVFKEIN